MASPSPPWKQPWHISFSSPNSSPVTGTSIPITVHPFIFTHKHRSRHPPSCCSVGRDNEKRTVRKLDKQLTIGEVSVDDDVESVCRKAKLRKKKLNLKYDSLFGRRKLWRRIFFASKKVRSILLLNVITLVYGKSEFRCQILLVNSI